VAEVAAALAAIEAWRAEGRRVAWLAGAFDVLNAGHVRALAAARGSADRLLAAVWCDSGAAERLGSGRPVLPAAERARLVAALRGVDLVVIADAAGLAALTGALGAAADAERQVTEDAGAAAAAASAPADPGEATAASAPGAASAPAGPSGGAVLDPVARVRALHPRGGGGA
jgi:hypothetical protein